MTGLTPAGGWGSAIVERVVLQAAEGMTLAEEMVSTAEICRILDVTPRTIARWKKDGCPCQPAEVVKASAPEGASLWNPDAPPADPGEDLKGDLWNVPAVVAWTRKNGKDTNATNAGTKKPRAAGGGSDSLDDQLLKEKIRKERVLANQYELELRKREGALVEREKVELQRVRQFTAIRNALLSIPGSVAASLVGMEEPAIRQRLQGAIDHVLSGLAGLGPKAKPPAEVPAEKGEAS